MLNRTVIVVSRNEQEKDTIFAHTYVIYVTIWQPVLDPQVWLPIYRCASFFSTDPSYRSD
jgi:hypothetical protein